MATFNTVKTDSLRVDGQINSSTGTKAIDLNTIDTGSMVVRQINTAIYSTDNTCTTTWKLICEFPNILTNCKPDSLIHFWYYIPTRNDSTNWGGLYIEPQISINEGVWQSLGSCGYDGSVMIYRSQTISSFMRELLIDPPNQQISFSVSFRFYMRSYDGTALINQSHDINKVSGTAPLMGGMNSEQHRTHIVVKEYAKLA